MSFNDAKVVEFVKDSKYLARRERVRLVKCAFIGTACSKIHIVPVALHPGFQEAPRPFDVDFAHWVRMYCKPGVAVFDLDTCSIHVDMYPKDSVTSQYKWTIFRSYHPCEHTNRLLRKFSGGELIRTTGSVLVVKSNTKGIVCDVSPNELYFIERMVVDTLRYETGSESDLSDSAISVE